MSPALAAECEKAVHVVTADGRVLKAGRAVLFVLGVLGYKRLARLLAAPPLVWGVEAGYALVARYRGFLARFF